MLLPPSRADCGLPPAAIDEPVLANIEAPAGGVEPHLQFHVLSFEGPDEYSRAGGLATRVEGLTETLAALGFETHLWFIGDPEQPGHEIRGSLLPAPLGPVAEPPSPRWCLRR